MSELTPIKIGDRVYDRLTAEALEITAIGRGTLLAKYMLGDEEIELAYKFDEVSIHPGYPELVLNVYRPNPFDDGQMPGRLYRTLEAAGKDPDWKKVFLQVVLTSSGITYTQQVGS